MASAPPPPGWCGVRTSRGPGTGRWWGRSTWSVPLRVSCPGLLLRLACLGGGGPVPVPPYLAWGCGGGGRASPGGVPSTVARGVWGQALPPPNCPPTGRAVGVRYPRAVGAGVWLWGPFSVPLVCTPCGGCVPQGGGGPSPYLAWGCAPPVGRVRGVRVPGGGLRGGGGVRRAPRLCGRGGAVGRGVALPCSVPLPSLGRQQSRCHWRRSVHGGRGPPYHSGSCSPAFSGRDLCGVLARWRGLACSPRPLWKLAAGAGGRVALRLLSRARGGGDHPPCLGNGGRGPRGLRAGGGGWGGGSRRGLPAPPLVGGLRYPILAPLVSSAHSPPACACGRGRGAAPGWGGLRGGLWTGAPGATADLNPPSALPVLAVVTEGSCGARPPYCSGVPPCGAPKLGARVAPARWCGLALRPRRGRWGARCAGPVASPPPPASRSLLGGGVVPAAPGGRRAAPVAP